MTNRVKGLKLRPDSWVVREHVGKLTKEGSVSYARSQQEGPFTQMLHYRSREARHRLGEAICSTGNQPLNE